MDSSFGEDIYSSSTHFLLELIQNADDNKYAGDITPTLALSYHDRLLRTDCNELGFTPEQVDAICHLGFSSKKNQAGSTGEKGVGFKSVFGVAASVWVASRDYTFKFDPSSRMGMLIPIWEEPPDGARHETTSMYLRFLPQTDETNVFHDLDLVGGKVLTFLRRLRELQLHIELQSGTRISYNVMRQDLISADGLPMTQLTFTGAKFPVPHRKAYVVCCYEINDMPQEKKRPRQYDSELQLAFPVDDSGQPVLESQDVYAVLPVRSYGFTVGEYTVVSITCSNLPSSYSKETSSCPRAERKYHHQRSGITNYAQRFLTHLRQLSKISWRTGVPFPGLGFSRTWVSKKAFFNRLKI